MSGDSVILEESKPFSESGLWTGQRNFYDQKGPDAWKASVPFYVTSNTFMAKTYANIILRFIQDWTRQHPEADQAPFYCLELGAGHGQLSYYLIRALLTGQKELGLEHIDIRYVMSDFAKKNIAHWNQSSQLKPFVASGLLDFACLDLENEEPVTFQHSGFEFVEGAMKNPCIVMANYVVDTLKTDVFAVENGELYESLASLSTDSDNVKDGQPIEWEKVSVHHSRVKLEGDHYEESSYNEVLRFYQNTFNKTNFLFPIASLNALKRIQRVSQGNMLLLGSDKAYSSIQEQENKGTPYVAFHGSFSLMANFDAIGRVFKAEGGDAFLQTPREGITTAAFLTGMTFADFPETRYALAKTVEGFSPGDYFLLQKRLRSDKEIDLEGCAALLTLTAFDPYIYNIVGNKILQHTGNANPISLDYMAGILAQVMDNFYFFPGCDDLGFNIALFFHDIKRYADAIPYYLKSVQFFGAQHIVFYNLGICYYEIGQLDKSQEFLKESLVLNPDESDAKSWLAAVEQAIAEQGKAQAE